MTTTTKADPTAKAGTGSKKSGAADRSAASSAKTTKTPPRETKIGKVTAMLKRKNGATIGQIVEATGWQSHTARAALTGLKKKGYTIASEQTDSVSRYRITASA